MKRETADHQVSLSRWETILERYSSRIILAGGITLYVVLFWQLYLSWLHPLWEYLGFAYRQTPAIYLIISLILAILPCLWIPIELTRPSQFIYWMFYLVVYVPTMFIPYFVRLMPSEDVLCLVLCLAAGFFLMGLGYRFRLHNFPKPRISRKVIWIVFISVNILFTLWILMVFRGQMKLVSTEDIYSQRAAAKDLIAGGLVGYPMLMLSGMINPVLMSIGLTSKRRYLFLLGTFGQILIYACSANKSVITSIVVLPIFYYLIKLSRRNFGLLMSGLFLIVIVMIYIFTPAHASEYDVTGVVFGLTSLILLRTIAVPGLELAQYHYFFSLHPITYLSHVNGINLFIRYPYSEPIGIVIANFFEGNTNANSNASMWATDGIAGFWLPGILIISVLCALVFWLLDSLAARQDITFATLTIIFAALNLSNASLFTSLISGGLLPLMMFLYFMPQLEGSP